MKSLAELGQLERYHRVADFAQYARFTALGGGDREKAIIKARKGGASPRVLDLLEKAVQMPGGVFPGTGGSWGEQLVSPTLQAFTESLKFSSAVGAAAQAGMFTRVSMNTTLGMVLAGGIGAEAGPGDAIIFRPLAVSNATVVRRKVAWGILLTNEFLEQAPAEAETMLTRELRSGVGVALDVAVLADILAGVTPRTASASPLDDARQLLLEIGTYENSRLFWVMGRLAAALLATDHDGGVRSAPELSPTAGGTFLGLPAFVTQAPAMLSLLALVDGARHAAALEEVEVVATDQALVDASDVSTAGFAGSPLSLTPLPATQRISLWQQNASAIRATQWFGFTRLSGGASAAAVSYAGSP